MVVFHKPPSSQRAVGQSWLRVLLHLEFFAVTGEVLTASVCDDPDAQRGEVGQLKIPLQNKEGKEEVVHIKIMSLK